MDVVLPAAQSSLSSAMSFFSLLIKLDKILCSLTGFLSPWIPSSKISTVYKLYTYLLYTSLLIPFGLFFTKPLYFISEMYTQLRVLNFILQVAEVYAHFYFYTYCEEKFINFTDSLRTNEKCLKIAFSCINKCEIKVEVSKIFVIILTTLTVLLCYITMSFSPSGTYSVVNAFRYLVALSVTLQWALCMQYIDRDLSKVTKLLKSVVTRSKSSSDDTDTRVSLNDWDNAIRAYRMVADNFCLVGDYYGVHTMCSVALSTFRIIRNPYMLWYCSVVAKPVISACFDFRYKLVVLLSICDFLTMVTEAAVCGSIDKKVRIVNDFVSNR